MCANIFFTAAANETSHTVKNSALGNHGKPHKNSTCTEKTVYVVHQNNEISNYSTSEKNMKRNSLLR
jgi:hypothetical protein